MSRATEHAGSDSAGQPWAGRHFEANTASDDDGTAPEHLIGAIRRFRTRELGEADVVDALRISRLLIPLVAHLGEAGENEHGLLVDKTQELAIVTVVGPDGRTVLPAFTSVAAMRAWNPAARPVPAQAQRVALAAASEQTDLVVVDATSATEFVIRRPALWAIAHGTPWVPSYLDEAVLDAFAECARGENAVRSVALASGDEDSRLAGPELEVALTLAPGLDRLALDALIERLKQRWSASATIADRVDSMTLRLASAA
jgi:hypothetical protein